MARYNTAGRPSGATGNYTGGLDPRQNGQVAPPVMVPGGGGTIKTERPDQPGFGITPPAPAPTAPAPQPFSPTMQGVNMLQPGAAENYFKDNQNRWTGPTLGQNFYNDNKGAFATPGQGETFDKGAVDTYGGGKNPQVTNNSQSMYQDYLANRPTLATDPGFGSYYQNAGRQASEGINAQMAARGMYGASAATDQISEAYTNLAADRAKNEAGYNLNRLAEQRNWENLGGNLAGQADTVSNMASQNQLSWLQGLGGLANQGETLNMARLGLGGNMAMGADADSLNYLNSGMNAAATAQGAQETRGQNYFNNEMGWGNTFSGMMGDTYNNMFGTDQGLLNDAYGMQAGSDTAQQDIQRGRENRINKEFPVSAIMGMI